MNPTFSLPVIYEDDNYIAINKPANLLVHRSPISRDKISVMQILKEELGYERLHPIHRLDRATSGVLLIAKNNEFASFASKCFLNHEVEKTYFAVIRGWPQEDISIIDSPLKNDKGILQDSETHFKIIHKVELPIQISKYPTSRYSLIRCQPTTGRRHQIRRHAKRLSGHIIGDTTHGKTIHNKYFRNELNNQDMLLYAAQLKIKLYPDKEVLLKVDIPDHFKHICREFSWSDELIIENY
jgi:tRNA pseudouridine65 synthase